MNSQYADIFFKELLKIEVSDGQHRESCLKGLLPLLYRVFIIATESEKISFTNHFSRISFGCQKFKVKKQNRFFLFNFRKFAREGEVAPNFPGWPQVFELGKFVTAQVISEIWQLDVPDRIAEGLASPSSFQLKESGITGFYKQRRVLAIADDSVQNCLKCIDEETGAEVDVKYNIAERNEIFNPSIREVREVFGFPVTLNLIDVEIDREGCFRPRALVVEPDFLIDVTAVAECFSPEGTEPLVYLLKKLLPFQTSVHLMTGNIANYFLDELMADPDLDFNILFPRVFRLYPLQFATMNDQEIRDIFERSKGHFSVIKKMVKGGFRENQIPLEKCYLEPSFYSETYGLQGRLDALYQDKEKAAIVELKSGKPFMANAYGLSNNHFIQTLLYDLLVRSAYGHKVEPTCYILYSSSYERPLRYAPTVKSQQVEAILVRNRLVALERLLSESGKENMPSFLEKTLKVERLPHVKGFHRRDLDLFERTFQGLSLLEKKYFLAFTGFIAREHQLAKTGAQGLEDSNGVASLWLESFEEKEEAFNIISHLKLLDEQAGEAEPRLVFAKTSKTNALANFRTGDIAVLYPSAKPGDSALNSQIFKVTIVEITRTTVTVRLRSRQFNKSIFEENEIWNLEHDMLDSSFTGMYRGLFEFASGPKEKRELLLGLRPPASPLPVSARVPEELTEEQQQIFKKIIASRDYFLLWGPPGTGKTSMMLKHLAGYYLFHTDENLLLLAYTNRAVDEICEAIENLGDDVRETYLRIGSRYGTSPRFHSQLLDRKIEKVSTRAELIALLQRHRIFVATVASFQGKSELLKLKKFNRVIIDEASQLLEPLLTGFLTQFEHFTLIGDHKQLPAVVVQDIRTSAVEDEDLRKAGFENLRNSFFERLYLACQQMGWHWAYDKLSHQGRMHAEIMGFPNEFFYEGILKTLPLNFPEYKKQWKELEYRLPEDATELEKQLAIQRMLLLPTSSNKDGGYLKTNRHEAEKIVELIKSFQRIFAFNESRADIGVITPYRAQIALIREQLQQNGIDPDEFTIDTVERYQGGARDVILISLCTNTDSQLASLSSLSEEGIDRKLNVALTRAREHLVLVGNPELLQGNRIYEKLIERCGIKALSQSTSRS